VTPKYAITIDARGPGGNIFAILAQARRLLQDLGEGHLIGPLTEKVTGAHSYEEALDAIREYFPLRLD
jgi:hypothetical protein